MKTILLILLCLPSMSFAMNAKDARDKSQRVLLYKQKETLKEFKHDIQKYIKNSVEIGQFESTIMIPEILNTSDIEKIVMSLKEDGFTIQQQDHLNSKFLIIKW